MRSFFSRSDYTRRGLDDDSLQCPSCDSSQVLRMTSYSFCLKGSISGYSWSISTNRHDEKDRLSLTLGNVVIATGIFDIKSLMDPGYILWFRNCDPLEIVDPSVRQAAEAMQVSVTKVCEAVAWGYRRLHEVAGKPICRHGISLNGYLCTTAVIELDGKVGLFNLVDLIFPLSHFRLRNVPIIPEAFFEVAPFEEAISYHEFQNMKKWSTRTCQESSLPNKLIQRRRWGHLLFLSHAWTGTGCPGTDDDLKALQSAVKIYVERVLATGPTAVVKNIASEEDFGIWLDYTLVPNDREHNQGCATCRQKRRLLISKMTAIPSVSTTIALHPNDVRRGWILHETTNNTKGNIVDIHGASLKLNNRALEHGHRVNLMTEGRVAFTNGSDGTALRCHEFVRLGQMPRCWPSVHRKLLEEFSKADVADERSVEATPLLFEYRRTFHHECQNLKRAMVVYPQLLARRGFWSVVKGNADQDNEWLRVQSPQSHLRFESEGASGADRPLAGDHDQADPFDLNIIRAAARVQSNDMMATGCRGDISNAAYRLQIQQFIAVVMGLRAELLHGAGILHWVVLSCFTDTLTTVKRSVRLHHGMPKVCRALCSVRLRSLREDVVGVQLESLEVLKKGAPESALVYASQKLFPKLRSDVESNNRSGREEGLDIDQDTYLENGSSKRCSERVQSMIGT